jgi:hypothetical protein
MIKIAAKNLSGPNPIILTREGKPGCLCCFCEQGDACGPGEEKIYEGFVAGGPAPNSGWVRDRNHGWNGDRGSCRRFLCLSVTYNETNDTSQIKDYPCGDPTCNNRNLLELVYNEAPPAIWRETRQLNVEIIFYGWVEPIRRNSRTIRLWRSCADDEYLFRIYRRAVNA